MFEHLVQYPRIVVSGPHRSGTTICAEMIAHDTGHRRVLEEDIHFDNFDRMMALEPPVVVQAPFLCYRLHEMRDWFGVYMLRDFAGIEREMQRPTDAGDGGIVLWRKLMASERKRYHTDGNILQVKLDNWRDYQRGQMKGWMEVEYESLRPHSLWCDHSDTFSVRQISGVH